MPQICNGKRDDCRGPRLLTKAAATPSHALLPQIVTRAELCTDGEIQERSLQLKVVQSASMVAVKTPFLPETPQWSVLRRDFNDIEVPPQVFDQPGTHDTYP